MSEQKLSDKQLKIVLKLIKIKLTSKDYDSALIILENLINKLDTGQKLKLAL